MWTAKDCKELTLKKMAVLLAEGFKRSRSVPLNSNEKKATGNPVKETNTPPKPH